MPEGVQRDEDVEAVRGVIGEKNYDEKLIKSNNSNIIELPEQQSTAIQDSSAFTTAKTIKEAEQYAIDTSQTPAEKCNYKSYFKLKASKIRFCSLLRGETIRSFLMW